MLQITSVGTREIRVDSVEEALLLLKLGLKHRHVAGTKLNYQSSRSHSIYTIKCIRTVIDKPSHAMVNRSVYRASHNMVAHATLSYTHSFC